MHCLDNGYNFPILFLFDPRPVSGESHPALAGFGRRLAAARQAAGLSLEDLAGRLRLGPEQLLALEQGEIWRLPEPVFVLAMARRVASALELDAESDLQALRDQLQPRPAPGRPPGATPTPVATGGMVQVARRAWRRLFTAGVTPP